VSDPYLAGLYNERGKGYLAIGEYEKAVKFFNKAVELDSIDDSYHFNFGLALAKSSNDPLVLKRAEDEMKKAIAIAPYRSDIYLNLANFYREFYLKEKGDIAVAMMKKARELDPLDATISHNFGVLYMQLGMYKGAIDEFKRYLEEEPNDVDAHIEISGAYRMNKEYDNALKEIDWLLNKNTNNNYAHFLKANILADMGRYDAAYAEYQLALREKGKEADVWYAIGILSLKQNKPKEAEEAFKKAAEYKLLLDRAKKKD
jgi:tetratricopeptide (TPR) repeat protein